MDDGVRLIYDVDRYMKARRYWLNMYRAHINNARQWRLLNGDMQMSAYNLSLAADARATLIEGVRRWKARP